MGLQLSPLLPAKYWMIFLISSMKQVYKHIKSKDSTLNCSDIEAA